MAIDNVTGKYTVYNKNQSAGQNEFWYDDGSSNDVDMQSFIQLMIAQLKNQDFNNTVDDTQYITQLAQFSTLQAMNDMTMYSKINYANTLVGREVAVLDLTTAEVVTGYVDAMSIDNNEPIIYVNNKEYNLSAIKQVYPNNAELDSLTNLTSLQMMSLASSLLGMKVDVVKTGTDGSEIITGTIDSIARVNGESVVYVNGKKYTLGEVVKVYPKGSTGDDGSTDEGNDNTEEDSNTK